ncbi:MAG TPA: trypco2 family protein [Streptosporangiaceae bacterium]|jgi:hypothetical protein
MTGTEGTEPGIGLADAIRAVREELLQAIEEGADSPLAFTARRVDLTFEVVFTSGKGGGAGIKAWVLSADFHGDKSTVTKHKVKVRLAPVDRATGTSLSISDLGAE